MTKASIFRSQLWNIAALLVLIPALSCARAPVRDGQPHLVVREGTRVDFGSAVRGEIVGRTLRLVNTGAAPLLIESCVSSCECTLLDLASRTIAPGDSTTLAIRILTSGFSDPTVRTVVIVTNERPNNTVMVDCAIDVRSFLTFFPNAVVFHKSDLEGRKAVRIAISNRDTLPLVFTAIVDTTGLVTAHYTKSVIPPRGSIGVEFTTMPVGPRRVEGLLQVRTTRPDQPVIPFHYLLDGVNDR